MNIPNRTKMQFLSDYLRGYADATKNENMADAADILKRLAPFVCREGFICNGGDSCQGDHK
jgi:hypothetical protein